MGKVSKRCKQKSILQRTFLNSTNGISYKGNKTGKGGHSGRTWLFFCRRNAFWDIQTSTTIFLWTSVFPTMLQNSSKLIFPSSSLSANKIVLSTICWSWVSLRLDPTIIFSTYQTKVKINWFRFSWIRQL